MIFELIVLFFIYVVIAYFRFFSEQRELDKNNDYLHLNKTYFFLGLLGTIVCCVLGIMVFIFDSRLTSIVFLALAIVFTFILSGYYGFRIYFDGKKIVYRKYYERFKVIYYKDITHFCCKYDIEIKTKDQTLIVPSYMSNYMFFLEFITDVIPSKAKIKIDSKLKVRKFRDSVYRFKEFVVAYIMIYALIIAFWLLMLIADKDKTLFLKENRLPLLLFCLLTVATILIPIVSIFSAKRAHSSNFCRWMASYLFRDGYLKQIEESESSISSQQKTK